MTTNTAHGLKAMSVRRWDGRHGYAVVPASRAAVLYQYADEEDLFTAGGAVFVPRGRATGSATSCVGACRAVATTPAARGGES